MFTLPDGGQIDRSARPSRAVTGRQSQRPVVVFDDLVGDRQAKTRARVFGLGGEERLCRALGDLGRDPFAVVDHEERDALALAPHRELDVPALAARIARVEQQVDEGLLE